METISHTTPKARKEHRCDWCGDTIKVGEIYERQFLKEDYVYVWKSHKKCLQIAMKLNMFENDGADEYDFREYIRDEFCKLWQKKDIVYYESKDFPVTTFLEDLDFVCEHHSIK